MCIRLQDICAWQLVTEFKFSVACVLAGGKPESNMYNHPKRNAYSQQAKHEFSSRSRQFLGDFIFRWRFPFSDVCCFFKIHRLLLIKSIELPYTEMERGFINMMVTYNKLNASLKAEVKCLVLYHKYH